MGAFSFGTSSSLYARFPNGTAQDQGGLLTGKDPTAVNVADPLRLWIIQFAVIISTVELLSWALKKIHQSRVIAEILGGILLGPTAFGRIPGFTQHIFPTTSKSYLSLVANIGLVLFLFLISLEINVDLLKRNARLSILTALGGIALPFGLGSAFSVALYKTFADSNVRFTEFSLFVGVAFSITGFPAACRLLKELKMLDTDVGVVVLTAGVANALVAWTLLALTVALVNSSSGLTALWIFLVSVSWSLFLLYPMRKVFIWLAHRTGSIENGPSLFFMMATLLLVFGSAFITDVIGVHAIFGGFLAGFVIPREGRLVIGLTETLNGVVSIAFIPLYFALSGLSTDLRLLNTGITWAFTISLVVLAYIGKFGGCTIVARIAGCQWRTASTIGALMSCKGLLELIVLNVGLAAGIFNQRVFSMFVLEALLLTFLATPVVIKLNPPESLKDPQASGTSTPGEYDDRRTHVTVVLDKMEHLSGLMTAVRLLRPLTLDPHHLNPIETSPNANPPAFVPAPVMHALRLIEHSSSSSSPRATAIDGSTGVGVGVGDGTDSLSEPFLDAFRTFGEVTRVPVSERLAVVPREDFVATVAEHANRTHSQLVLVSWLPYTQVLPGSDTAGEPGVSITTANHTPNPFDTLFKPDFSTSATPRPSSVVLHSHFVRGIFERSNVDVALFVDRGFLGHGGSGQYTKRHILLPFLGGPDDRLALAMVVQCCADPGTTAKIVRVKRGVEEPRSPEPLRKKKRKERWGRHPKVIPVAEVPCENGATLNTAGSACENTPTLTELQSEVADDIAWQWFASSSSSSSSFRSGLDTSPTLPAASRAALLARRVEFVELTSSTPIRDVLVMTAPPATRSSSARPFIVVGRGARAPGSRRCLPRESHRAELNGLLEDQSKGVDDEVRRTMGDLAAVFFGVKGSCSALVVVQAVGSLSAVD